MARQTSTVHEVAANYEHLIQGEADDIPPRTRRAMQENMLIIPQQDSEGNCTGLYDCYSSSGNVYMLDPTNPGENVGMCRDLEMNEPEGGCKHLRRLRWMLKNTPLPEEGEPVGYYMEELSDLKLKLLSQRSKLLAEVERVNMLIDMFRDVEA